MRRTKTMLIGDVLDEFFKRPYVARRIAEGKLPDTWRKVVGEHVANMTSDLKFDNGILHIKVESALIRQELFYQREALKDELNRQAGVHLIGAVIIK